jgi:hypothetical protein
MQKKKKKKNKQLKDANKPTPSKVLAGEVRFYKFHKIHTNIKINGFFEFSRIESGTCKKLSRTFSASYSEGVKTNTNYSH